MSSQIRFFVVRNDLSDLLRFAEQKGCRAIPQVIETDSTPSDFPPTQFKPNAETGMGFFYLLPEGFSTVEAFYDELEFESGRSKLLARTSPVIEVSPGTVGATDPVEGRIYHCQDESDPRYSETHKVFEQLKRFINANWSHTANGSFYIGPATAQLMRSGTAEVTYGGKPLELVPD